MKNIKDNIMRTTILILLWVFVGPLSGFANNLSDEDKNKTDLKKILKTITTQFLKM